MLLKNISAAQRHFMQIRFNYASLGSILRAARAAQDAAKPASPRSDIQEPYW
jgi:hypothetical protein